MSVKESLYQEDNRPISEGQSAVEGGEAKSEYNCFWYWLVAQFYQPNDSFSDRLRKGFIGLNLVPLSIIAISFALYGLTRAENTTYYIVDISNLLQGFFCIMNYIMMRRTSTVSESQIAIVMWVLAINITVTYIGSPDFDNKAVVFGVVFLCIALQHPHLKFIMILLVIQGLVIDWNNAWDEESGMRAALPGHKVYPPGVLQFAINVVGSIILACMTWVFNNIVKETQKKELAQTRANEMTLDILRCQKKYDTDTVDAILDERAKEGEVDAELITLFRAMNKNLLAYKPFLPNYLFLSDEDEEGELGMEDTESAAFSPDISGTEKDRVQPFHRKGGGGKQGGRKQVNTFNQSCDDSAMGDGRSLSSFTNDDGTSVVSRGSSKGSSKQGAARLQGGVGLGQRGALFKGRISFALLDLSIPSIFSFQQQQQISHFSIAEGLAVVVNSVYSLAQETRASVHSMLGDKVQLTWNATNPVAQAETKAAHFMCRLANKLKSMNPSGDLITVAGCLCSGSASVHSITSTTRQQAMVIHMPSLPLLEAGLQLAKKHRTVLMDEVTRRCCSLEILSFPVEQAQYTPNHAGNTGCSFTYHPSCTTLTDESTTTPTINSTAGTPSGKAAPTTFPTTAAAPGVQHQQSLKAITTPAAGAGITASPQSPREEGGGFKSSYLHEIVAEKQRAEDEWMYQLQGEEFLLDGGGGNVNDPFNISTCNGSTDIKSPAQAFAYLMRLITEGKYEVAMNLYNTVLASAASSTAAINGGPVVFNVGGGGSSMENSSSVLSRTGGGGGGQQCFPSQSFLKEVASHCRKQSSSL